MSSPQLSVPALLILIVATVFSSSSSLVPVRQQQHSRRALVGGVVDAAAFAAVVSKTMPNIAQRRRRRCGSSSSRCLRQSPPPSLLLLLASSRPPNSSEERERRQGARRRQRSFPDRRRRDDGTATALEKTTHHPAAVGRDETNVVDRAETMSRRSLVSSLLLGTAATAGTTALQLLLPVQPARATYSAYARREQDWQRRVEKGDVQFESASSLRKQLREIVPENAVGTGGKIFCPNGPSSNVSPLMENKCSDTVRAMPSVYGRSDDIVGNSIPGFQQRPQKSSSSAATQSLSSDVGGFPKY